VAETEPKDQAAAEGSAEARPPERDVLFAIQVGITDFIASYWQYFGYAIAALLVGMLGYGAWDYYQTSQKDESFAAIARISHKMPKPDPMAQMGFGPADDPNDAGRMKDLEEGARRFEEIATDSSGAAAVVAWQSAADAWKRAGKSAERMAALEKAAGVKAEAAVHYAAVMVQAGALLETPDVEGNKDKALGLYQALADSQTGFLAQEAWVTLIRTQVFLDRLEEAKTSYATFKTKFPNAANPELEELLKETGS
jgi:tetratricopeptide (TPR) repeat protein